MNGRKLVKGDPRTQAISRAGAEATRLTFQRRRLTLPMLTSRLNGVSASESCQYCGVRGCDESCREYAKAFASRGGIARAATLSAKRRSQIARKAARARWGKPRKQEKKT